ncbi:MAG: Pirin [Gammaproteobacteria bacterium]|jgi:redox-sensitive bicupin YhaK (pirin superfamily)|nr:Pirin [Gammaproteobacteria bacterium]
MSIRQIQRISTGISQHWVGDGFPVNTMFSYLSDDDISPFLLLDYAGPADFKPSDVPRGVDYHPHRGFETVTIVYQGEVVHRDTAGHAGKIGPGDVQWMTAARGVLHEEKHSDSFTYSGGTLEMVQLWVNLPARYKMSTPRYQGILTKDIPIVTLGSNIVRVIAGSFLGVHGIAKTFTPVHLYDIRLIAGASLDIPVEPEFNASLLILEGEVDIAGKTLKAAELVVFSIEGGSISIKAEKNTKMLFMSGAPISEPIVGSGPFVMNTEAEIRQAFHDFKSGKFV